MSVATIIAACAALVAFVSLFFLFRPPSKSKKGRRASGSSSKTSANGSTARGQSPAPKGPLAAAPMPEAPVESLYDEDEDDEADITMVTVRLDDTLLSSDEAAAQAAQKSYPDGDFYDDISIEEIDDDLEPHARAESFVADSGADEDHPTMTTDAFLVAASAQSDQGRRRKNNEDSCLLMKDQGIFFVADGMGGYEGGEIASQLAVDTIETAFREMAFEAKVHGELPRRPTEVAQAMQAANLAIWEVATDDPKLRGMGTTLVGARFSLRKNRVYIGHVGDSRCYRLRGGAFRRLTVDHTLEALGHKGPKAKHLFRAVGIGAEMDLDIITAVPNIGDVYLFCSDGLTKMIRDDDVRAILAEHHDDLEAACKHLVDAANSAGGKDNTTVVLVSVCSLGKAIEASDGQGQDDEEGE